MLEVTVVETGIHSVIVLIDGPVLSDDRLVKGPGGEAPLLPVVGDLGEVRDQPGDWLPHDDEELDVGVHGTDPAGHAGSDEVAGTLLYSDLSGLKTRHLTEVPGVPAAVVGLVVEEVNLLGGHPDCRVQGEHLDQSPRPAFPHSDDDAARQLLVPRQGGAVLTGDPGGGCWRYWSLRQSGAGLVTDVERQKDYNY